MAAWRIRLTAKKREPIDKDLLVQAILAVGRQMWAAEKKAAQDPPKRAGSAPGAAA